MNYDSDHPEIQMHFEELVLHARLIFSSKKSCLRLVITVWMIFQENVLRNAWINNTWHLIFFSCDGDVASLSLFWIITPVQNSFDSPQWSPLPIKVKKQCKLYAVFVYYQDFYVAAFWLGSEQWDDLYYLGALTNTCEKWKGLPYTLTKTKNISGNCKRKL